MEKRDYYEILGIDKKASASDIKKAYRKLVKKYHPDVNKEQGAEEKFKEIQEAYEVLSNDSKREAYDKFGHAGAAGFNNTTNGGNGSYTEYTGYSGEPFDMGDIGEQIYRTFFGGNSNMNDFNFRYQTNEEKRPTQDRGADIHYKINLSFDEAMKGGEYKIKIAKDDTCTECNGTGSKSGKETDCPVCHGTGQQKQVRNSIFGQMVVMGICQNCKGTGKVITDPCPNCKGTGVKQKEETINIRVPAGAYDGMILRFTGGGNTGRNGGTTGDLYIELEIGISKDFERRGNDIYSQIDIPVYTAVLGGKIDVKSIFETIKLKIPKGTQSGTIFRVKGNGCPVFNSKGERGDQYIQVDIDIPKKLSRREKQLWEAIEEEND